MISPLIEAIYENIETAESNKFFDVLFPRSCPASTISHRLLEDVMGGVETAGSSVGSTRVRDVWLDNLSIHIYRNNTCIDVRLMFTSRNINKVVNFIYLQSVDLRKLFPRINVAVGIDPADDPSTQYFYNDKLGPLWSKDTRSG